MRRRRLLAAVTLTAGLVLTASPAWAHVTINPDEAAQGGFTAVSFRVPNERDDSGTTSLTVEFPTDHPITSVSVKPKPGWTANVERAPLPGPIEGEGGGEITEAVSRITWTGGRIAPGEFDEFDVSMGPLPDDTDELVFNALQTYESGEVVRWIEPTPAGGPEPEFPAPVLRLVAGGDEHGVAEDADEGDDVEASADESDDSDDSETLAVVALIVGGVGLLAGVTGIVLGTRRRVT
jgi:periplasmic copper chaperone A